MATVRLRPSGEELRVGKIVCVGANYASHNREMGRDAESRGEPFFFLKPPTALVREGAQIHLPAFSSDVQHELELVLLIGRGGSAIGAGRALDHLAGVGVGLDLTARDLQREAKSRGRPWSAAKGFDDSAPVSDFVALRPGTNPDDLQMSLRVNGELRQRAGTAEMLFGCARVVSGASIYFRLEPGDLLFTGTPEGVGPVAPGDTLDLELEGLVRARFVVHKPKTCSLG